MRAFSCLVAALAILGLAVANPIPSPNTSGKDLIHRDPQIDPPWWNAPNIPCATTWPEEGGQGPPFTWHNSPTKLSSRDGFVHAHVFVGCDCRFWDNLEGRGPPRAVGVSDGKGTDWWGDLHFRAFAIQCNPIGWHRKQPQYLTQESDIDEKPNVQYERRDGQEGQVDTILDTTSANQDQSCGFITYQYNLGGEKILMNAGIVCDGIPWIQKPFWSASVKPDCVCTFFAGKSCNGHSFPATAYEGGLPFPVGSWKCDAGRTKKARRLDGQERQVHSVNGTTSGPAQKRCGSASTRLRTHSSLESLELDDLGCGYPATGSKIFSASIQRDCACTFSSGLCSGETFVATGYEGELPFPASSFECKAVQAEKVHRLEEVGTGIGAGTDAQQNDSDAVANVDNNPISSGLSALDERDCGFAALEHNLGGEPHYLNETGLMEHWSFLTPALSASIGACWCTFWSRLGCDGKGFEAGSWSGELPFPAYCVECKLRR